MIKRMSVLIVHLGVGGHYSVRTKDTTCVAEPKDADSDKLVIKTKLLNEAYNMNLGINIKENQVVSYG